SSTRTEDSVENVSVDQATIAAVKKVDLSTVPLSQVSPNIENKDGSILKPNGKKYETMSGLNAVGYNATENFTFRNLSLASTVNPTEAVFHVEDKTSVLKFVELKINDEQVGKSLIAELKDLFGKPTFEQNAKKDGGMGVDEQGNAITIKDAPNQLFMVWEKSDAKRTYFLSQYESEGKKLLDLTILDPNEKFAKQFMSVRSLDWYK
ncbi:MAG: hypothetical protein ACN6ON_05605, partial [Sphingobacterium sp.]